VVARLGGDEFVMLLPSCSLADTGPVLKRLHDAMPEGQSCSAGACEWDRSSTASEFLQQADEALYAVKRGGRRNRVMQRVDAKHDPQRVSRD
jgi:GGDEF domain-containing protein